MDHFCMEGDGRKALGDLWHDVTCQYIALSQVIYIFILG